MADEIHVGKNGGKSSALPVRYDLLPPEVLQAIATTFCSGAAKYGDDNWRLMEPEEVYNHLMAHLVKWRAGDTSEDHLVNVACRAIMLCWLGRFRKLSLSDLAS